MTDNPTPTPSSDNPYIRTYAKDVAALTGKHLPVNNDPEPIVPIPPTPAAPPLSPAPPAISAGIATQPTAPVAQSTEPDVDKERADVLARLRERAAANPIKEGDLLPPSMPLPMPILEPTHEALPSKAPPQPSPLTETPILAPILPTASVVPSSTPLSQPAPTPTTATPLPPQTPTPPVENIPLAPPEKGSSPLHTYSSDFSDRIDTKEASAFSVLAAQSDQRKLATPKRFTSKKSGGEILIMVASVTLVLVGIGGAIATYLYVSQHASVAVAPSVPSLIFADDRQEVSGEGVQLLQALASSAQTALPDGKVRVLYLTTATTTAAKQLISEPLPGGQLIGALQLPAPDVLLRNIAPESTVGIVHAGNETRAFFIIRVLSYESTFSGMLTWENTIGNDLVLLYPAYPAPIVLAPIPVATTTVATTTSKSTTKKITKTKVATSTPIVVVPVVPIVVPPHFVDEVTSNHDVRALKDGSNRTILLYGYYDKQTLIIARDEAAFGVLLNRLGATSQQ